MDPSGPPHLFKRCQCHFSPLFTAFIFLRSGGLELRLDQISLNLHLLVKSVRLYSFFDLVYDLLRFGFLRLRPHPRGWPLSSSDGGLGRCLRSYLRETVRDEGRRRVPCSGPVEPEVRYEGRSPGTLGIGSSCRSAVKRT